MDKDEKFLKIITALNKKHRQGENQIFDCGELGFVHIWWRQGWEHQWFEPSVEFKEE